MIDVIINVFCIIIVAIMIDVIMCDDIIIVVSNIDGIRIDVIIISCYYF